MKKYVILIYIIFLSFLFISCKKNVIENYTVDSVINEYKEISNKDFISKYKNKKYFLEGTIGFCSQNKEKPGTEYYVIFDSNNIDYDFLTGNYVSCELWSEINLAPGDKIKVLCTFDKLYKSLETENIGFKKGKIIEYHSPHKL